MAPRPGNVSSWVLCGAGRGEARGREPCRGRRLSQRACSPPPFPRTGLASQVQEGAGTMGVLCLPEAQRDPRQLPKDGVSWDLLLGGGPPLSLWSFPNPRYGRGLCGSGGHPGSSTKEPPNLEFLLGILRPPLLPPRPSPMSHICKLGTLSCIAGGQKSGGHSPPMALSCWSGQPLGLQHLYPQ